MKLFNATEVVPINFVFFTASAILAGRFAWGGLGSLVHMLVEKVKRHTDVYHCQKPWGETVVKGATVIELCKMGIFLSECADSLDFKIVPMCSFKHSVTF